MKDKIKKVLIIISIVFLILVVVGLVTSYADSARVRNGVEPKHVIKIVSKNGNKVTYWGLGYKVVRYLSVSPNEPYKNNIGVKYGSWFMKYDLEKTEESSYKTTEIENVSINISDISLTGATIIIKDTNINPYTYGEWYKLEKQVNGKWYEIETVIDSYGFNSIAYLPDENNEVKFVIEWEWLYGELSLGSYRILKEVGNKYISIEFGIATTSDKKIEIIKPEYHNDIKFNKYLERDNKTIYLAGNIEEVYYTAIDKRMTLKDYITKSYQTVDDGIKHLTDIMNFISSFDDGGTTIHKSDEYDITIIKCNTISGNKDIFIGDYSMNFDNDSMCK